MQPHLRQAGAGSRSSSTHWRPCWPNDVDLGQQTVKAVSCAVDSEQCAVKAVSSKKCNHEHGLWTPQKSPPWRGWPGACGGFTSTVSSRLYPGGQCRFLLQPLLLLQDINPRVGVTHHRNIAEDGLCIDYEVRDPEEVECKESSNSPRWRWSGSLPAGPHSRPMICKYTLCYSWGRLQHCSCASWCTHLPTGHFCPVSIYKLHLESPEAAWRLHHVCVIVSYGALQLCPLGQPWEERIQYVCCYTFYASQERINKSAVSPHIFFQLPRLHLAYLGFSKQWDTARQLANISYETARQWVRCPHRPGGSVSVVGGRSLGSSESPKDLPYRLAFKHRKQCPHKTIHCIDEQHKSWRNHWRTHVSTEDPERASPGKGPRAWGQEKWPSCCDVICTWHVEPMHMLLSPKTDHLRDTRTHKPTPSSPPTLTQSCSQATPGTPPTH